MIDITADQSPAIPDKIIYSDPTFLMQQGLVYLPWNIMGAEDSKPGTLERARLLEQLLGR